MKSNERENENTSSSAQPRSKPHDSAGKASSTRPTGDEGVIAQMQESGREIAGRSIEAIGSRTRSATSAYQSDISMGLHTLADGLRQTTSTFQDVAQDKPLSSAGAKYIEDLAGRIDSVSDYFENADAEALMKDVKGFARRNPAIFVGGAFAAGFALSRLIRSASSSTTSSQQRSTR